MSLVEDKHPPGSGKWLSLITESWKNPGRKHVMEERRKIQRRQNKAKGGNWQGRASAHMTAPEVNDIHRLFSSTTAEAL